MMGRFCKRLVRPVCAAVIVCALITSHVSEVIAAEQSNDKISTDKSSQSITQTKSDNVRASKPPPLPLDKLFGGPFTLVDQHGQTRTDKDFHGKYMLIYFGYTHCPDICPLNLSTMSDALAILGDKSEDIVPIFITIDPDRDTQALIGEYVGYFGDNFVGMTGTLSQIRKVAKAYRLHRRKIVLEDQDGKDEYFVDHSNITHLVGPDGKHLTLFPHATDAETMAQRMLKYLPKDNDKSES